MRIVRTADGSDTIELPERSVTYHSMHGALRESRHVFIEAGLYHWQTKSEQRELRIFELGFGSGLNALLTQLATTGTGLHVDYYAIEPYPLPQQILCELNYPDLLDIPRSRFLAFHEIGGCITTDFQLHINNSTWASYEMPRQVDLVYLDAFGPRFADTPWAAPAIKCMYDHMRPGGVLVTFCAQGAFKRHLKGCGFHVEALPGPPGKREMTRASKVK